MNPWTLHEGDCLELLPTLGAGGFDAVVTDPPYSSGGLFRSDRANFTTDEKYTVSEHAGRLPNFSGDNMDQRSWQSWCYRWMAECRRLLRPGGYFLCFSDWRQLPALTDAVQWAGLVWRGVLVWDKTEAAKAPHTGYFGYQCEYIVWASNGPLERKATLADGGEGRMPGCFRKAVNARDKLHQTGKPTDVLRWLVRCCPPGGVVLDPFAGSGTTAEAALREGRRAVLVEREAAYCDIIRRRMAEVEGPLFCTQPRGEP